VSYPDVRNRLNSVGKLAIDENLDLSDTKQLLEIYNHETEVE
jgi:hypothetical protein